MILRLQQGKSEARMEEHQYRRYAEKRFAHDALDHRDAAVRSLVTRLRACQVRLLHLGFPSSSSLPASLCFIQQTQFKSLTQDRAACSTSNSLPHPRSGLPLFYSANSM
jgi:hypothetical protein